MNGFCPRRHTPAQIFLGGNDSNEIKSKSIFSFSVKKGLSFFPVKTTGKLRLKVLRNENSF